LRFADLRFGDLQIRDLQICRFADLQIWGNKPWTVKSSKSLIPIPIYYVTPDGAIRVTLDFCQAAYDQRLSPRPNLRVRLPIADAVVIEIKTGQEHAERLQDVAARFPVLRSRNSKYARGLLAALG